TDGSQGRKPLADSCRFYVPGSAIPSRSLLPDPEAAHAVDGKTPLPDSVILRRHAVVHGAAVAVLALDDGDLEHAPFAVFQQARMHRGGGEGGVVGVDLGAPDGPRGAAGDLEVEDLAVLTAQPLHDPRIRPHEDRPLAGLRGLDLV